MEGKKTNLQRFKNHYLVEFVTKDNGETIRYFDFSEGEVRTNLMEEVLRENIKEILNEDTIVELNHSIECNIFINGTIVKDIQNELGLEHKMDRIVNLHYKVCPKLFKYILKNKRDIVLDRWKLVYINVSEKEIEKLKIIKELKEEVERALNSPICHNCGIRTTAGYLLSYRGQKCIGRSIECPMCYIMGDKTFWKIKSLDEVEKNMAVEEFIMRL